MDGWKKHGWRERGEVDRGWVLGKNGEGNEGKTLMEAGMK